MIDTGALALTCAYNAVVVGDVLQLPNVITDEDKTKLEAIMSQYHIAEGYDCGKNSFLQSVLDVMKGYQKPCFVNITAVILESSTSVTKSFMVEIC